MEVHPPGLHYGGAIEGNVGTPPGLHCGGAGEGNGGTPPGLHCGGAGEGYGGTHSSSSVWRRRGIEGNGGTNTRSPSGQFSRCIFSVLLRLANASKMTH